MSDKPLHVQVAEALGCKPKQDILDDWNCACAPIDYTDRPHGQHSSARCDSETGLGCDTNGLARYDTDWAATGPLIEKYRVALCPLRYSGPDAYKWRAVASGDRYSILDAVESRVYADSGPDQFDLDVAPGTPLLAVCALVLALGKAGKL